MTAGETLTYTLDVVNHGPAVARNVLVVDALPDGTTLISTNASQGLCNAGVTCELGDLGVDASAEITIVVQVDSGQIVDLLNLARVAASNPESDETNNDAFEWTEVSTDADLEIDKQGPAEATPGTSISYQIVVTNTGPSNAQSVQVVDAIPTD